jgi:hypothetical protein
VNARDFFLAEWFQGAALDTIPLRSCSPTVGYGSTRRVAAATTSEPGSDRAYALRQKRGIEPRRGMYQFPIFAN